MQQMRCGILIIGSLLWDDGKDGKRAAWRTARLAPSKSARVPVQVPIYYGRNSSSRGNTYTTVFRPDGQRGQAIIVPCLTSIDAPDSLIAEATALWQAEAPNANNGTLHASSGCVGALFREGETFARLSAAWTAHFRKVNATGVSVVNADGLLDIDWPAMQDGPVANFDIILATANQPEDPAPTAQVVADAWANQCGFENYFFNNVNHGIRTPDDGEIWRRVDEKKPCWLENKRQECERAIDILRSHVANST